MADRPTGHAVARRKLTPAGYTQDHVVRNRLLQRLDEATERRCTVVAAGPGYGKSLLLASWVGQQDTFDHVAWLTLDHFDADPPRLCSAVLQALQEPLRGEPGAGPLLQLRPAPAPPYQAFVDEALIPALEGLGDRILLVVDDVHHLSASPSALAILDSLIRWAPQNLHIVLAGRAEPPLSLQRLRLTDELSVVRQQELACTPAESAALLRVAGLHLRAEDSAALHELTQGWPAALRLAALSLAEYGSVPEFLSRFVSRDVALADYLASEVLHGLPDALGDFVLRATIDDQVCGDLVDAVTGSATGAAMLAECERRNLFLTRLAGAEEDWYAWHNLFAEQMRRRLVVADAAEAQREHGAAARWWRDRDLALAVRHALSGQDPDLAVKIFQGGWLTLALRGEATTLLELLASLPTDADGSGELHLAACYARLLDGDVGQAGAELHLALESAGSLSGASRWRMDALAAWLGLFLVDQLTGLREAVVEAQRVVDTVPPEAARQPSPEYALALLALGMGTSRLQEDSATALRCLRTAASAGRAAGLDVLDFIARAEAGMALLAEGDPGRVEREATEIVEEARRRGWEDFSPVSVPLSVLAWLRYWKGDTQAALGEIEQVLELCPRGDWSLRGLACYFHARASLLLGDVPAAERDLAAARALADAGCLPPHAESLLAGLQAEILAEQGDLDAALEALGPFTGQPEYRMTAFTRADLLRRTGRPSASLAALDALPAQKSFPHTPAVDGVLRALALRDLGEDEAAHQRLDLALRAAEPAGLLQPFLVQGDALRPLLEAHLRRGTVHEVLASRIAERLAAPVRQPQEGRHSRLTTRELSILRYLRTSLSNAEIAEALFVSVNTVKTHTASIYRKLAVSGRREAVRRAEELGLLSTGDDRAAGR